MEHPDHLSSVQQRALLAESKLLTMDALLELRSRNPRAVVKILALPGSPEEPHRQEFRIVTVRGEFGDRDHQQSIHGTVSFTVLDDGYNDALLVALNITSPLNR